MAQCHAHEKKHPSAMDLYVGVLNSKLYSPNKGSANVDHRKNWSRFDASVPERDESFRNEIPSERMPHFAGSFREDAPKRGALPHVDYNGKSLPKGDYRQDSDRSSNQNGGLFVGGLHNGGHAQNDSNGGAVLLTPNGSGNAPREQSGELPNPKGVHANGIIHPKKENGNVVDARGSNASSSDFSKGEARSTSSLAVGSGDGSLKTVRNQKLKAGDAVSSSNGENGNRKSGEQNARSNNSGEQISLSPQGGINPKGSRNANAAAKGSPNGGKFFDGSLIIGSDSSSTGGSSNGGSPTSEAARGGGRTSSASSIASNGSSPSFLSSRGVGNIMGVGSITGNLGNLKLSTSKARFNDNQPTTPSLQKSSPPGSNAMSNVGNLCKNNRNGLATCANGNVLSSNSTSYGAATRSNGECQQAKRILARGDPEEIKNAGNEHYRIGQYSEALAMYDKAISLCPNHAPYRSNRAMALTGLGKLGEAMQEFEEAIRLDPCYARAHQRVASLYLRLGLVESAKKHFQSAGQQADLGDIQRLHSVERHISRCVEARNSRNWDTVVRESDAAVVVGADSAPQIFGYKSEALLKLRKLEEADGVCTAAERIEHSLSKTGATHPNSFLFTVRAQVEMALGRFEGAIGAAECAVRIDPSNAEVTALLRKARAVCQTRTSGNELFNAGRFFEACALYGEGLESDPTNAVLLCNRAACRSKLGQWEKAIEDCDAALSLHPGYTKALMRRAQCNTKLERWEDARRDYELLRTEMPSNMDVARGLFDVQVAVKKSRGEEIYKMKFGGEVEEVSSNDQFREAVTSPGLSVVQFNTRWSDRCRQLSPFIDQLCKRYPCVNFLKVDVDDNPYLAKTESVSFVPTFKIYKNGQKVKDILGPSQQALEYAVRHYCL